MFSGGIDRLMAPYGAADRKYQCFASPLACGCLNDIHPQVVS